MASVMVMQGRELNTSDIEGERVCGEWLMEAHGTIYQLPMLGNCFFT